MGNIIAQGIDNNIEIKCSEAAKSRITISIQGNGNTVVIEEGVIVADSLFIFIIDNNNEVRIGKGTTFEETVISVADNNNHVIIGEDCMFARKIQILASDFHSIIQLNTGRRKNISKGITIQNHVWVGYNVTILKNTYVYANSIIAAGTVLNGIVGANSIYFLGGGKRKFGKPPKEVTWERLRDAEVAPLVSYEVNARKINKIEYSEGIIPYIDNDMAECLNKITGLVYLVNREFKDSEVYFYVEIEKAKRKKGIVIPLALKDLCNGNEEEYLKYRFDSYMPAEIIHNQEHIKTAQLLVKSGNTYRRKVVYKNER